MEKTDGEWQGIRTCLVYADWIFCGFREVKVTPDLVYAVSTFVAPLVGVLLHISCTLTGFMWSHWCERYTIPLRCHISQNKHLLTSSLSFFIPHVVSLISTHPGFFFYSKGGSSRKKNKTKKPTNHCSYKKKHRGVAK